MIVMVMTMVMVMMMAMGKMVETRQAMAHTPCPRELRLESPFPRCRRGTSSLSAHCQRTEKRMLENFGSNFRSRNHRGFA
eukprot:2146921-Rhodomonas_salina.1